MNLYSIAKDFEEKGYFPKYEDFHLSVVCAIIGQRIAFTKSRKIRLELIKQFNLLNKEEKQNNSLTYLSKIDYQKIGCDKAQIERVGNYLTNYRLWPNIKGIGKWTIDSITLITRKEGWKNIWLDQDSYVKKAIETLKINKENYKEEEYGLISLLLWRLKKESRSKLLKGEKITKVDLL